MSADQRDSVKPTLIDELCRYLYSLVLLLLIPLVLFKLAGKKNSQDADHSHGRFERFGMVPAPRQKNGYLFHCVSVGEVVAASCVIKQLLVAEPNTTITVTTTTATGSARVRDIFGDKVNHFYLPFDLPIFMLLMLRRVQPKAMLITEVELWPNLIHTCWKQNIPVIVINARMTSRSAVRYKKIGKLFKPLLLKISHVCAQGQDDYRNYVSLGLSSNKLTLTNNIKFDQAASVNQNIKGFMKLEQHDGPVLVAGSTHAPEESQILEAAAILWNVHPNLKVVIVPRHPERFDEVAELLTTKRIPFTRSSVGTNSHAGVSVVLLDEMGKLNDAYSVATIAFVGGSIAQKGGHNALEPAAFSLPILMGPNVYNNPVICDYLVERGALTIIHDAVSIAEACNTFLSSDQLCKKAGRAAGLVLEENSGALDKTIECIAGFTER